MESTELGALRLRARRTYELSRLCSGAWFAMWALPAIAFSLCTSNSTRASLVLGAGLVLSVIGLRWMGRVYSRAVVPSLLTGSVPLVLPMLLRGSGHTCFGGVCWSLCMVGCIGGGLAAGATIGWLSAREGQQRWAFLGAALIMTTLTGSLGCALVGVAGTVGMALAVVISSLPVSWVTRLQVG